MTNTILSLALLWCIVAQLAAADQSFSKHCHIRSIFGEGQLIAGQYFLLGVKSLPGYTQVASGITWMSVSAQTFSIFLVNSNWNDPYIECNSTLNALDAGVATRTVADLLAPHLLDTSRMAVHRELANNGLVFYLHHLRQGLAAYAGIHGSGQQPVPVCSVLFPTQDQETSVGSLHLEMMGIRAADEGYQGPDAATSYFHFDNGYNPLPIDISRSAKVPETFAGQATALYEKGTEPNTFSMTHTYHYCPGQ